MEMTRTRGTERFEEEDDGEANSFFSSFSSFSSRLG